MKPFLASLFLSLFLCACAHDPSPQSETLTSPSRTEHLSRVEATFNSGFWGAEFTNDGAGVRSLDIKSFEHEDLLRITIQEIPIAVDIKGYLNALSKSLSDSEAKLRIAENYSRKLAGRTFTCRKHINTLNDIVDYSLSTCVTISDQGTTMIMFGGADSLLKKHAAEINAVLEKIRFI